LNIKEKYNPMTDQEYIHLKQQQKKRSKKLKKDREHWYMEENGIKEKKDEEYTNLMWNE
jgi:hypothetical protein